MKSNILCSVRDFIGLCISNYDAQHALHKAAWENTDWTTNQGWDKVFTIK